MFSKTDNPNYPYIRFINTLGDPTLADIDETDAARLNERIKKAMEPSNQDFRDAYLCAQKMAIYHGVPGLIQFLNITLLDLARQLEQGEYIQQQAFNALSYLQLAQRIFKSEPGDIAQRVSKLLPDEKVDSPSYWQEKQSSIVKLAGIEPRMLHEAITLGNEMFGYSQSSLGSVAPKPF